MAKQLTALRKTVRALKAADRLKDVDSAHLAIVEGMAAAVEDDPTNAALWKEYRAAVSALVEVSADDDSAPVVALVGLPASLGHKANAG